MVALLAVVTDDAFERELAAFVVAKRWSDVLTALERRAAEVDAPVGRARLFARAGSVALEHFDHRSKAIAHFESSLHEMPDQPQIRDRLRLLYERRRDWEALARLAETPEQAAALRERARRPWWRFW